MLAGFPANILFFTRFFFFSYLSRTTKVLYSSRFFLLLPASDL